MKFLIKKVSLNFVSHFVLFSLILISEAVEETSKDFVLCFFYRGMISTDFN